MPISDDQRQTQQKRGAGRQYRKAIVDDVERGPPMGEPSEQGEQGADADTDRYEDLCLGHRQGAATGPMGERGSPLLYEGSPYLGMNPSFP